jgi:hypothetical protein
VKMGSRYVAAKLFLVLAALCAFVGAVLFRRGVIGLGLSGEDYLDPLNWILIPRLIPFAASILSGCFGLVYFGLEKVLKRPANIPLVLGHLVGYLLGILGHATMVHFWWRVLGDEHAIKLPFPLWASALEWVGFLMCAVAFGANIFLSVPRPRLAIGNLK